MSTEVMIHKTPLNEEHKSLNAKMVEFGGWEMPLQYESILQEYTYNRDTVSIFDCSHMGEFFIKGEANASGLSQIVTQDLVGMPDKTCRYGAMLNEAGGVIDDLIVYRINAEEWMVVVNAANIEKDAAHFQANLADPASFHDASMDTAKLDIQGPLSREVLLPLVPGIEQLEYYGFDHFDLLGESAIVSRTGYTGELGYEIYFPWKKSKDLWNTILQNDKVKPTGLGVRDVLRVEMCYSLYGHELTDEISPLEAGLKPFIDFEKDFIGKAALLKQQEENDYRKVICIESQSRRAPRQGQQVFIDGQVVGEVTSGTFSSRLEKGVGLALVGRNQVKIGDTVQFGNEKSQAPGVVVKRPFYKNGSLKN